jgi:predicted Ser/Thr protein kinase
VRRLASRGEAETWFALGPQGAPVALKQAPAGSDRARAALRHESDLLQMLEVSGMPGTPRVLEADFEAPAPWLALSWCDGANLIAWSREAGRSLERRARVADRLVGLYVELHERGVLHGDPHPCNARIDESDRVRLVEFGAASLAEAPVDPDRAMREQQAVADMACRLISGQAWLEPLQPVRGLGWPAVERVLTRALAVDPADRWASLWAFGRALSDVVALRRSA